ncbi:hypothetical protein M2171_005214 [Bradyrhizobium japonicum USDA 38]|nr:hypothetical protein [Bradyrhizobium japonicum USDA 38]MCS3948595.1 hypothetical protein [Bradyrhizobium japonicum]
MTAPAAVPGTALPFSEAERRQVTVMFADLVGSTAMVSRLDPEEMRKVIRAYQDTVAGEISRYAGHVAKFMGDGVLAYFGWPKAHEDDAERAARAGLAVTQSVAGLTSPDGQPLAARVGGLGSRIPRTPFDGIEGYNSDRIGVLAGQEILQDGLEVGVSLIRLAPGATGARAEVFKHQIDVAVEAVGRHDRGRGTHTLLRYYKGEENGPGSGGIKGVGRGRSATAGQRASDESNIRLHLSFPLNPLSPEEKGPSSKWGMSRGLEVTLDEPRGRRENLANATMFLARQNPPRPTNSTEQG